MHDRPQHEQPAKTGKRPVKKPYRQPAMVQLGSLRDLTMATTGGSANDGTNHMKTPLKTGRGGRNGRGRSGKGARAG